jgi:hypothetical protein
LVNHLIIAVTTEMTEHEHSSLKAPIALARRTARIGCAVKARLIDLEAPDIL